MKLFLPYEKILIFIPVLLLMASCSKSHPVNPNAVVLEKEKRFISFSDGTVIDTGGKEADLPGYDITGLLTGSEGTMALVTKVIVRLMRKPEAVKTLLAVYDSAED